jgi:predicted DNA-binding transcriptional regulator AlpA
MRTKGEKYRFLRELREIPNVSVVCKRVAIDKSTIYRWLNKDEEFKKEFIKALEVGRDSITDLAEGQLITHIKKGSMRATTRDT